MTKKPAAKAAKKAAAPAPAPAPKKAAPRRAPAPLDAGLVVPKGTTPPAPPPLTLTAPQPEPEAPKRRRKDAVEGPTESMGFRVSVAWAKEFRRYSFERGTKMHQTLMDAFDALREKEAGP